MPTPKRILLAEDNVHDVELTLTALGEYRLADDVIVVRNGEEALDYLHRQGAFMDRDETLPVVCILDLKMPKVDGLEVLRQMKSDSKLRRIPVVMLTSSREERDLVSSYRLGANSYVVKPVDFQKYVEAIKQIGMFWAVINEPPPGQPG